MSQTLGFAYHPGTPPPRQEFGVRAVFGQDDRQRQDFAITAVFEEDERRQVGNTSGAGVRMLVRLKSVFEGLPPQRATGFLISPRTVLTCAHAVCTRRVNGPVTQATQVFAAVAASGIGQYPFGDLPCDAIAVAQQYLALQNPLFDYGVVQLPQPLGEQLGWFGVRLFSDELLQGRLFNLIGYPAPEPASPPRGPILEDTMWGMPGPVAGTPQHLTHSIDTSFGQSGAPLYSGFQENGEDVFLAAGIHQGGNYMQNQAVRFRPDILQEIGPWRL